MSRGRGGPLKESDNRHPPPDSQANENYFGPGPSSLYPRAGPQQSPYSSYHHSPARPVVPIQPPPAPSLSPSAPPISKHRTVDPTSEAPNSSYNQNHGPNPAPNSFQYQQAEFLRGHSSEEPQFRASPRGGGGGGVSDRCPSSSSQHQSGSSKYSSYPNNSSRGRREYSQDQTTVYPVSPRSKTGPRPLNQNQFYGTNHNPYAIRQCRVPIDSVCEHFQTLSLHRDGRNRGGERFDRRSASRSSAHSLSTKVDLTLNSDIQDQVQRTLAALKPSQGISAKLLAKKLHLSKKIVNQALYLLARSKKASKQGLLPPEWSLCREPLRGEEDQNSKVQSPPSHLCVGSGHPPEPEAKVERKTETVENGAQSKEEDSNTESSSSYCISSDSSDSEESQSPAKGQHQEKQHPVTTSSPDPARPTMPEQKELVMQYLLDTREATALVIAKNLGLKSSKQVNPTLYSLEKQGEVVKNNGSNPPTWDLSNHRRERMERSLKASKSSRAEGDQIPEPSRDQNRGESVFLSSLSLPPILGLELLPLPEGWMPEQSRSEVVSKMSVLLILYSLNVIKMISFVWKLWKGIHMDLILFQNITGNT